VAILAQFALPDVVERLREIRDDKGRDQDVVVLNACDPAMVYGSARSDGPQAADGRPLCFARVPSTWVIHRGLPVLVARGSAADMTTGREADEGLVRRALGALLEHLARFEHRVRVERWNGEPVLESIGQHILEATGFYRDYPAMTWDRRP